MKHLLFAILCLIAACRATAQNTPKTLLWEVSMPGNTHLSYLFGTFHDVSPAFFNTLPNVVQKFQQSEVLFVEEEKSRAGASEQTTWNQTWDPSQWKTILTRAQDSIFNSFVTKAEDNRYYTLPPLILSLTVGRLFMLNFCETNTDFTELMDHHIENLARQQQKQVYSLDDNQTDLLNHTLQASSHFQDSLYASHSIHYMQCMLDNDLTDCSIMHQYKNIDLDYALDTDLNAAPMASPLLAARNKKWVSILEPAFLSHNCFVAVGVRHLFFMQGLIQLLRSKGFVVRPIPV
jgi:uncharacterized protein